MNRPNPSASAGAGAFGVYEKQIATELASENTRLETDIARRRDPLRALINSVELRTSDGEITIPFQGLDTSVPVPGGRHVRCERFPGPVRLDIPLRKLARDQETKLYVSGQCAGNFPAMRSDPSVSDIDVDGKCLTMRILDDAGKIGLFGKITNLVDADFRKVTNTEDDNMFMFGSSGEKMFGCWLQSPEEWTWTSPDAIFTPTHVTILILDNGHPDIGKMIRIMQRTGNEEISPLDDSRTEAISVTNNPHNRLLLETNLRLKAEKEKLNAMQDIFEAIEISDGAGNKVVRPVSCGFSFEEASGWSVVLPSECDFIDMNNLHEMQVSVSGVRLRKSAGNFSPPHAFNENFGLQNYSINIEFDTSVTVIGCLDMGAELNERQIEVMEADILPGFMHSVLDGVKPRLNFRGCTFSLRSVHFKYRWDTTMGSIWADNRNKG